MNYQKQLEKRTESWQKHADRIYKRKQSETWEGRARLANQISSEMFDENQVQEIDKLDFVMF